MKPSSLLIIAVVIGLFSTGLLSFYAAILSSAGLTAQNLNSMNNSSSVITSLEAMYNITEAGQNTSVSTTGGTDIANQNLISAAINGVMRGLFTLPNFFINLIYAMTREYVPSWLFSGLVAVIMVVVLAAIYYFVRGVEA